MKVFFAAIAMTSFICASESPSQVVRTIKTSVSAGSLRKNDFKKIDVDEMLQSAKSNKSDSPIVRVRKQSFGNHDEFLKSDNRFKNEENITAAVFKRNRSGTK